MGYVGRLVRRGTKSTIRSRRFFPVCNRWFFQGHLRVGYSLEIQAFQELFHQPAITISARASAWLILPRSMKEFSARFSEGRASLVFVPVMECFLLPLKTPRVLTKSAMRLSDISGAVLHLLCSQLPLLIVQLEIMKGNAFQCPFPLSMLALQILTEVLTGLNSSQSQALRVFSTTTDCLTLRIICSLSNANSTRIRCSA